MRNASGWLLLGCLLAISASTCNTSGGNKQRGWLEGLPVPKMDLTGPQNEQNTAVFAGGCFWCIEAVFEYIEGVDDVVSGYAGGSAATAHYQTVSRGNTNHAEVVRVIYDPDTISYGTLLRIFFASHDPTQRDRQGPDIGPHYRSSIFYSNEQERQVAQSYIDQLNASGAFEKPIATKLEALTGFYAAETYHQDYAQKHPDKLYIRRYAHSKVKKIQSLFPDLIKGADLPQ